MDIVRQECVSDDEWSLVSHEKIESVLQELSNNWPSSLQMYNFIRCAMLWSVHYPHVKIKIFHKLSKGLESIIANLKMDDNVIAVYSLCEPDLDIATALEGEKIIKWNELERRHTLFCSIPKELSPSIEEAMMTRQVFHKRNFNSFWLPADLAKSIKVLCPEDMHLSNLEPRHAETVVLHWPYATENTLSVVTQMINVFDTVGIFTKKDSVLVSWVLSTFYGIGMLHTIDEHRRKGYGSVAVKQLVKSLGNKGIHSYVYTLSQNHAADTLFMKIGFKQLGQVVNFKAK